MRTHPTHPEALLLLQGLRDMFPAAETSDAALDAYAELLTDHDMESIVAAFQSVTRSREARSFPAWGVIEQALAEASPARRAWLLVTASLDARSVSPPEWPDPESRKAAGKMGGWGTFLDWDGSTDLLRETFLRQYDAARDDLRRPAVPRLGEGEKTINVSGDDHCAYCEDDGWVELAGTATQLGMEYARGATACRWCEQGEIVYKAMAAGRTVRGRQVRSVKLASDYDEGDLLHAPIRDEDRITKEHYAASPAGRADPALRDERVTAMLGLVS